MRSRQSAYSVVDSHYTTNRELVDALVGTPPRALSAPGTGRDHAITPRAREAILARVAVAGIMADNARIAPEANAAEADRQLAAASALGLGAANALLASLETDAGGSKAPPLPRSVIDTTPEFEYADEETARRCGNVTAVKEALKRQVAAASADVDDTDDDGDLPPLKPDVDDDDEVDRLVSPLVRRMADDGNVGDVPVSAHEEPSQGLVDALVGTPPRASAPLKPHRPADAARQMSRAGLTDVVQVLVEDAPTPARETTSAVYTPRSGIGSDAFRARLVDGLARVGAATKPVNFDKFLKVPLEQGVAPDESVVDEGPLVPPHDFVFIPSQGFFKPAVVDADKRRVQWPWEAKPYLTGGIGGGEGSADSRPVRSWHPLDAFVNKALDQASRDGKRGRTHTGVKAWFSFCEETMGTQADRPLDPNAPLWAKLEEEWLCMRFVCALVEERGITPESARVYFSSVQGWHAREHVVKLAGGLKLERLPQMLKGLKRIVGEAPRAVRRGIAPQMLRKAMDLCLDPKEPLHANIRAALATALQGLLRSAEYTTADKRYMLTRADLVQITERQAIIMMHPCKNMHHLGGKTCPLVIGAGGDYVDAVAEIRNMLEVDPAGRSDENTPLFRDPATNAPLSYDQIEKVTKELMAAVGEDPSQFSTHSYRIGGATALFAAGANETVIRTMGRWSSDMHRLYVRACFEQCVDWTKKAGSTKVSDLCGTFDEVDFY